jgi:hypothetical protein
MAQKAAVVEAIEAAGHIVMMLPKCHPEFNFIELWWGARKEEIRAELRRSEAAKNIENLKHLLKEKFNQGDLTKIRSMFHKSCRNMYLYKNGVKSSEIAFMSKQLKSHRRVPQAMLDKLMNDIENRKQNVNNILP